MNSNPSQKIPYLFYSTWGRGFYSNHWVSQENYWMYATIKFIEANLDFSEGNSSLNTLFEKMSASDYEFMCTDKSQKDYASFMFDYYYKKIREELKINKDKVLAYYFVDPTQTFFSFIEQAAAQNDGSLKEFTIYKIGHTLEGFDPESVKQNNRQVTLTPEVTRYDNLNIYYQFFILQSNIYYLFTVKNEEEYKVFKTPEFGIPVMFNKDALPLPMVNVVKMTRKLIEIWGPLRYILDTLQDRKSKYILSRKELEKNKLTGLKLACFKYNKEVYSLLRFYDIVPEQISVIVDDQISLEDASEMIQIEKVNIPVINDANKIKDYDFNAVLFSCGINFQSEIGCVKELLKIACNKHYPVISLYNDILQYDLLSDVENNRENFFTIGADCAVYDQVTGVDESELYIPEKTLAVFGTDTVQGKFTTQIYLREALKKRKINAKHFSTEPTGILLGADIGFSRFSESVDKPYERKVYRSLIGELEKDADLLITGGQNSIVFLPFYDKEKEKDLDYLNRSDNSSTFIYEAFLPKYIILLVSVDIESSVAVEAINYIDYLNKKHNNDSKILALGMLKGKKHEGSKWCETFFVSTYDKVILEKKQQFENETGLKVYMIPDEIDSLADLVEKNVRERKSGKNT